MSEDKNQEQNAPEQREEQAEEVVFPAHDPDASHYVLQPTRYKIRADVEGEMPEDRFMEEVKRGSDEETDDTFSVDAHPAENRPAMNFSEEDDTSGRAALKDELQERYRK